MMKRLVSAALSVIMAVSCCTAAVTVSADGESGSTEIQSDKTAQWTAQQANSYNGRVHGWKEWETAVYMGFTLPDDFTAENLESAEVVLTTISASNSGTGYIYSADYSGFTNGGDYVGDNAPTYNSSEIGSFTTPTSAGEFSIDVTDYIKMLTAESTNAAFRIDVKSQNINNNWIMGTTSTGTAPKLALTYGDGTRKTEYDLKMDGTDTDLTIYGTHAHELGQQGNTTNFKGGYGQIKRFPLADTFTFSAWVRPDSIGNWARIFDFGADTSNYIFFSMNNGSGQSVIGVKSNGGTEQNMNFTSPFKAGEWAHIAVTMDSGKKITAYVNGVEQGSFTTTISMSDFENGRNNYLGKSQWANDAPYYGCIDEVSIRNTALSAEEIKELMNETAQNISSYSPITVNAQAGVKPQLPDTVPVTYANDMTANATAVWNDYDAFSEDGEYTVNGVAKAHGKSIDIQAKVIVESDSKLSGYSVNQNIYYANNTGVCAAVGEFTILTDSADALYGVLAQYNNNEKVREEKAEITPVTGKTGTLTIRMDIPAEDAKEGTKVKLTLYRKSDDAAVTKTTEKEIRNTTSGNFAKTKDITLTNGSIFGNSAKVGIDYVKSVDVDRLLAPSYEVHGLTPPNNAQRYGGWERESANSWVEGGGAKTYTLAGHSLGHWMSAAAVFYAETRDAEVLEKLNYAVSKLDELQQTTGSAYIGGVYEETFTKMFEGNSRWASNYWVPWYGIHKIYQGLIDAYYYADNETALKVVTKFSDWAVDGTKDLSYAFMQTTLNTEYGGMNEVFAEMYEITGDEKYLTIARRFTHDNILNPLISGTDSLTGLHANTQIPKIIGAAELYEQNPTAYTDYKKGCENFWDFVVNNRSYAIGGNSIAEHFEAEGAETLGVKTCESCNSYNMLKLTEHLYSWSHNVKYMDYYENVLYNHLLGQQDPDTGSKMYFVSLLQGHHRIYEKKYESWWCCTGTGLENPGRYTRAAYYTDADDLYVNLYIPTTYSWSEKGLTFKLETNYPYSDKVRLTVTDGNASANIKLRAPSWLTENMTAKVNGGAAVTAQGGRYLTLDGEWKSGDVIDITIPMSVTTYNSRIDGQIAYKYGPITLAAELSSLKDENGNYVSGVSEYVSNETILDSVTQPVPYIITDGAAPETLVEAVDRDTLTFKIDGEHSSDGSDIELKPFYEIHHYFHNVYWNKDKETGAYDKALNAVTVDVVQPDGQQDEIGHQLISGNSHQGSFTSGTDTYYYRDAYGSEDAYFQYTMQVNENTKYLFVRYWGADGAFWGTDGKTYMRDFNIYVDGTLLTSQQLTGGKTGAYDVFYDIADLADGRDSITVKFAPKDANTCAGGMLEMRTVTDKVDGETEIPEENDGEIIKNGDFENTSLTRLDWTFKTYDIWYSDGEIKTDGDGNSYASVTDSGIGQNVAIESGKTYKLTAKVKSTGTTALNIQNGDASAPGSLPASTLASVEVSGSEWHTVTLYYTADENAPTHLFVYLWSGNGAATDIDDVSMTEVTDYITELSGYFDDDGNLNYEADYITESENAVLYVAMYDKDGALVSRGKGKNGELKGAGDYGEHTLKAFLWEDMKPLADTKTETVRYTEDGMSAYMFVHFTGAEKAANQEQIYFSVSTDGKEWEILNGGENILTSTVGEKGVRDPYIVRSPKDGKYYIIATDLSIYNRGNNTTAWEQCQNAKSDNPNPGSKNIVVWESGDLVNWSSPRLTQFAPDDAGCCWAPECIWDEEKQSFLVFGASRTSEDDYTYLRLYGSYTTDFETFTEPQLLMDASESNCHVFDTTITKAGDKYYRIYKTDHIQIDTASSLSGEWSALNTNIAEIATNHEGPTICKVNGEDKWNLMLDKLSPNGYIPFITDNLAEGQFTADTDVSFPAGVQYRHGAIMPITGGEYKALIQKYRK